MHTPRSLLLVALACLALASGCGDARPPSGKNLLIVSFDTLRADRLGAYGNDAWGQPVSPHADALAARGTLFTECRATRGQTHPSIASMLTGKFPITTGLRENSHDLDPAHRTLFELLAQAGYRTGVFVANFERGAPGDDWVFRGAQVAADGFAGRRAMEAAHESVFQQVWDRRVEDAALGFLDEVEPGEPFAAWVHFYDIHKPYNPPEGYANLDPDAARQPEVLASPGPRSGPHLNMHLDAITLGDRPVPPEELRAILGLYDATVKATDDRLGRLLARLAERGLSDDTYVVFTADHGEELFDRNRYFYHGASIYDGTVRIPLAVVGPDLPAGRRVDAPVQNIDIAPTVLELLELEVPADMEGRSLAALVQGRSENAPRPLTFVEWQDLIYAVSDGRYLYIDNRFHIHPRKPPYYRPPQVFPDGPQGFAIDCFEAYDLRDDPGQERDLLAGLDPAALADPGALPPEIATLRRALEAWLREPHHERSMDLGVSSENLERMQELGYTGVSADRQDVFHAEPCGD